MKKKYSVKKATSITRFENAHLKRLNLHITTTNQI